MIEPTPLRPDDQVAGGFLHVTLGGKPFELKVLPMGDNRKWTAHLAKEIRDKLNVLKPLESADEVATLLAGQAETMMDLLLSYDAAGAKVLPDREWIDKTATDRECYEAMKRVTAAAYPFGPDLLHIVPELVPMLMQSLSKGIAIAAVTMASSRSTSGLPPSTTGQPTTSTPTSPTSSSPSTSRKPRRGASKPPLPS